MEEYSIVGTLGLLIMLQGFIIFECMKMKGIVSTESLDLKTELGNLSLLIDEAIDYIAEGTPSPALKEGADSMKSIILNGLLSQMMMPSDYGEQEKPQDRQVHFNEETNEQEESI